MISKPDGFTCPRCGRVSHNPMDAQEGYCGACHDYTAGPVVELDADSLAAMAADIEAERQAPLWTNNVGITAGLRVMVAAAPGAAEVNGFAPVICLAYVRGPVDDDPLRWWLDVELTTAVTLPQMYHADEFLGVPARGLVMRDD